MTPVSPVVFLLDVDNTLLENDQIIMDLKQHLTRVFGAERQQRYWTIFENLRAELGYADYLGALQRYRAENSSDPHFLQFAYYLLDYPFVSCLYPNSLEVIKRLSSWGPTVIVSDGDVVFQPWKVRQSGLYDAVEGRALIYIHKEQQLDDIEKRYPARHYVFVDDKLRILTAVKRIWGSRLTTVFPRQGHYAHDRKALAMYPPADVTISRIGDLLQYKLPSLIAAAQSGSTATKSTPTLQRQGAPQSYGTNVMHVLVIDVGGTHVKILVTGQANHREFRSGPRLTPEEMVCKVLKAAKAWSYDVISIGYPGPVLRGKAVAEPHNLGSGWVGFDFESAFGCPVKLINDAAMQALGSYEKGSMLFLGLGTGLGSAMIVDGIIEPMELGHLPYRKGTFEDYVGIRGLKRFGKNKWRRFVEDVVARLSAALEPDYVVLGGGNVNKLKVLPPNCCIGENANAFCGGFRLWEETGECRGSVPRKLPPTARISNREGSEHDNNHRAAHEVCGVEGTPSA